MAQIKKPAIVIAFPAHSFGVGPTHDAATEDNDPLLISTAAAPQDGWFIWNHLTEVFEAFLLDGSFGTNANTHPKWAPFNANFVSMHQMFFAALKQRYPTEDLYLVPLGRNSGTMVQVDFLNALNERSVVLVDNVSVPTETHVYFSPSLNQAGNAPIKLSGLSGLTPDINGTYSAVDISFNGTRATIPTATTGVAVVAGATVNATPGCWDPGVTDESSIFVDYASQMDKAYEWLWAADLVPDPRAAFVCLGVNDAIYDTEADFEAAMNRFVTELRLLMQTDGDPKDAMAIVWLEPIITTTTPAPLQVKMETVRTALRTKALADGRFVTVNVDEGTNPLTNPVAMSADTVHPTYRGFMQLAKAMVDSLDDISTWNAPIDL